MMTIVKLFLAVSLVALAACGNTTGDRALSGAGIGAATGAVGGALLGSPATGAVVGGAVGAGVGGLTKKKDLDLGDPLWK
jgi:osmotically inducible lipoprotein OsmB